MAGTYVWTKLRIFYRRAGEGYNQSYECENETDWVTAKEKIPAALEIIGDDIVEFIQRIIRRSPHEGFVPSHPIAELKSIHWRIYSRYDKLIKGGECKELQDGDMPVSFATNLPKKVDDILGIYHTKRKESYETSDTSETTLTR